MTFWMIHGRTGDQARTYFMLSSGDAQYRYNAENRERKYQFLASSGANLCFQTNA